jgi:hypothetical protein
LTPGKGIPQHVVLRDAWRMLADHSPMIICARWQVVGGRAAECRWTS